jgi:hypothetical protein
VSLYFIWLLFLRSAQEGKTEAAFSKYRISQCFVYVSDVAMCILTVPVSISTVPSHKWLSKLQNNYPKPIFTHSVKRFIFLWNPKIHHCVHRHVTWDFIKSEFNSFYYSKILLNIIHPLASVFQDFSSLYVFRIGSIRERKQYEIWYTSGIGAECQESEFDTHGRPELNDLHMLNVV